MRPGILLDVRNLTKHFPVRSGPFQRQSGTVRAVTDVSFQLSEGESLSLVGESGCGKTTLARTLLRGYEATAGSAWFRTEEDKAFDLLKLPRRRLKPLRRQLQMIFQDPYSSLNPRMTVQQIIGEPLRIHAGELGVPTREGRRERVRELLLQVGLRPEAARRYPHAFSGGERQRIGIARTLATRPRLVVADEPVSALDVSVQAQILNLMLELQNRYRIGMLLLTHNLMVVRHVSDRVAVMYLGRIMETAPTETLFTSPGHPYTAALLDAIPRPDPRVRNRSRIKLGGVVPSPRNPPSGCPFHPRCVHARDRCRNDLPELEQIASGHQVRCHLWRELDLNGAAAFSRRTPVDQ
ncbi:MAG: ATP-binding cassette domain-containing protein [Candidatus Aminicenantes bacterium]|nr:ATP-binding cassette domain-containing protein [Candidatus Aminicenantes bacterium]